MNRSRADSSPHSAGLGNGVPATCPTPHSRPNTISPTLPFTIDWNSRYLLTRPAASSRAWVVVVSRSRPTRRMTRSRRSSRWRSMKIVNTTTMNAVPARPSTSPGDRPDVDSGDVCRGWLTTSTRCGGGRRRPAARRRSTRVRPPTAGGAAGAWRRAAAGWPVAGPDVGRPASQLDRVVNQFSPPGFRMPAIFSFTFCEYPGSRGVRSASWL